jgi:hypothetical protein
MSVGPCWALCRTRCTALWATVLTFRGAGICRSLLQGHSSGAQKTCDIYHGPKEWHPLYQLPLFYANRSQCKRCSYWEKGGDGFVKFFKSTLITKPIDTIRLVMAGQQPYLFPFRSLNSERKGPGSVKNESLVRERAGNGSTHIQQNASPHYMPTWLSILRNSHSSHEL